MAPEPEEYEITVFGSGRGESSVIHVGHGKWIIIDSCLDRISGEPAALTYLRSIGVRVTEDVCLVMATHWHEDHIKGLSRVFAECKLADFALPCALSKTLAAELFATARSSPVFSKTGVSELTQIFEEISARKSRGESCEREYTLADRTIPLKGVPTDHANLIALSPSNDVFHEYAQRVKRSSRNGHLTYVELGEENDISVASWLQFSDTAVLFGADLNTAS